VGPNTLRLAHSGANTSKGTSAERKASEIWFRKCGHGERLFSQYYKGQPGVVPADKWQTFEETLNTPLPVTFRLHGFSDGGGGPGGREQGMALELLRTELEKEIDHLHPLVQCVDWAPKSAGIYQCAVDKRTLSKDKDSSELAELLADGVSSGLLNRQEAVSMLPVMALKVEPGMCCLDTCASPGSKTMQLLEAVAAGKTANGLVVANDAHPKRVHQLMDTIDRHSRPAAERARLVVTCHRGEEFPRPVRPFINKDKVSKSSLGREALVGFDRVLCDVPCSGDGTIRKDATVRPRWTPAVGNQLHAVQLDIAWRGLCLLRVGGLMAYSTCTYNPIEDEAVVAGLLARANAAAPGSVELEEWPDDVLPKLVRHAGLHHWGVADHVERSGAPGRVQEGMEEWSDEEEEIRIRWHRSLADARAAHMAHAVPTMWPPAKGAAKWMRLERCSRLLPHDQDTGGFFIALLRKKAPFPASSLGSVAGVAARDADARGAAEEDVAAASLDSMDGEGRGSREGVDGGLEGGGGRGKAGKGKRGGGKGRDAARRKVIFEQKCPNTRPQSPKP
jgi:16S rRNA C967 or C1407 C5-methylase (RsmB/RsmF family)